MEGGAGKTPCSCGCGVLGSRLRLTEIFGTKIGEFMERDEYSYIPLHEARVFTTSYSFGHSGAWESKS
jgi:hypothetical protein